jgi:hypothetical protein
MNGNIPVYLETRAGFLSGGWHGPVVVAGKPEESRLYRRVARLEKTYMPLGITGGVVNRFQSPSWP